MRSKIIILLFITWHLPSFGQVSAEFPLKEWSSTDGTHLIFYITGDGGLNKFSTNLCDYMHSSGYSVTALNAKSYFWDKKTPDQFAGDIDKYLNNHFKDQKNLRLILTGYSFGADVIPFIINKLQQKTKAILQGIVLLSPSSSTDFEIHVMDMFGWEKKRGMDVVNEINQLGSLKTITVFGSDEKGFPVKQIRLKNYNNEILPGGHHFEGNTEEVGNAIMKYFR
jgi:type IV secretory pathway VirJ component